MVFYVNLEHPKDVLLFYVAGPVDDGCSQAIGQLVDRWAAERAWIVRSPMFVLQEEEMRDPVTQRPVITAGGVCELYSAHGEWRGKIPRDVDEGHFRECQFIVDELAKLSAERSIDFHFEFQGEFIGAIEKGHPDERLSQQFLGTWARALGIE